MIADSCAGYSAPRQPDMQKPALIRVVDQFGVKRTVPLEKQVFTIGRRPENDLHLPSSRSRAITAAIVYDNGTYYLVDKASTRGLFLNGQRITAASSSPDQIGVGSMTIARLSFLRKPSQRSSRLAEPQPSQLDSHRSLGQGGTTAVARYVEGTSLPILAHARRRASS